MRDMTFDDLISHFTTPSAAARALSVDRRLVDAWKERRIPSKHQLKAEFLSEGKLQADQQAKDEGKEISSYVERGAA